MEYNPKHYSVVGKITAKNEHGESIIGYIWQYFDGFCKGYRVVTGHEDVPVGMCGYSSKAKASERWKAQF